MTRYKMDAIHLAVRATTPEEMNAVMAEALRALMAQLPPADREALAGISVAFAGTIKAEDVQDRVVTVDIPASALDDFARDPVTTWIAQSGFDPDLLDMRGVQMSYRTRGLG